MTDEPCAGCGADAVAPDGVCDRCGLEALPTTATPPTDPHPVLPDPPTPDLPPDPAATTAGTGGPPGPTPPPRATDDDLDALLLVNPALPERKRVCRNPQCRRPVGRSRDGRPGRVEGFCRECQWPFDFRPPLAPGTVVKEQYEVRGALGRGGLGWTYLARNLNLEGRQVVLKGVSEPDLPGSAELSREELRALLTADHPNIVRVLDKVAHPYRPPGPSEQLLEIGYIVMELVHGRSLRQVREHRAETGAGPLPPADVCDRMAEALEGLGHLHDLDRAYNDFSDDNVMETPDGSVRVIDLGGVTRLGTTTGLQRKRGYADPTDPPASVQADLFTVGRTALRLTVAVDPIEFRHAELGLPAPEGVPLFRDQEAFHLLLRRTTDPDPARRFATARENAEAFRSVGREIRSGADEVQRPGRSPYFGASTRAVGDDPDAFPAITDPPGAIALALPELQVDVRDRHAGRLTALPSGEPETVRAVLGALPDPSPESRLVAVRAGLRLAVDSGGTHPTLDALLRELPAADDAAPPVWRASFAGRLAWTRGLLALALDTAADAEREFRTSLEVMPGEAAPKLALAHCAELRAAEAAAGGDDGAAADHRATALRYFEIVWRTDRSFVDAALGLARCRALSGDRAGAEEALREVPRGSRHASNAALCALRVATPEHDLARDALARYFERAERLDPDHDDPLAVDERRRALTTIDVLRACRARLDRRGSLAGGGIPPTVLGWRLDRRGLARGLEHAHRTAAALPGEREERDAHVDAANRVRSWSVW